MPTVMRRGPYRFHFYSREPNEPPHIHVERDDMEAKFWLRPVRLARNHGFREPELIRIANLVRRFKGVILKAWRQHDDSK